MPVYANSWRQTENGWTYQNDDGSYATGWNWIEGKSYYFDADGNLLTDSVTPDGFEVNENGEWVVGGAVQVGEATARRFGSKYDAAAKGYWSDINNLTWTWFGGDSIIIGNGSKYIDLYPETTDREVLLKEYVNYPGEGSMNLNIWGDPKANFEDDALQLLKEFVHSFDWINSDELTRLKAVYSRISLGKNGNLYGSTKAYAGTWTVLRYGEGICVDYAGEFKRLANYIGLECEVYSPQINHETCMVKVNGQWITVDPSLDLNLFNNLETVPVVFADEYNRSKNEYKESDSYSKWDRHMSAVNQYECGEITYDELERIVAEIYN